jgi:hypothetical protein
MRSRKSGRYLGPVDLSLLQQCFDTLTEQRGLCRSCDEANLIASALFEAYSEGFTDKAELMRRVDIAHPMLGLAKNIGGADQGGSPSP